MDPYYFHNLKPFYSSMKENHKTLEYFSFKYHCEFECLLDIGVSPFQLLVGISGISFAFILEIKPGFKTEMKSSDYFKLCDILDLNYKDNSFSSLTFLNIINSNIPSSSNAEFVSPEKIYSLRANTFSKEEKEEGFIFCGWLPHAEKNNGHVRNIPKTRKLLGSFVADFCEKNDISSKWTTDESKRIEITFPTAD